MVIFAKQKKKIETMINKITTAIFALMFAFTSVQAQNGSKQLSLNQIVDGEFVQKTIPEMVFMADGLHYAQIVNGDKIVKYSLKTGKEVEDIMTPKFLKWQGRIAGFELSKDNNFILIWTDKKPINRHSYKARYYFYDIRLKRITPIAEEAYLMAATMSDDYSKIAYVKENNIFIYHTGFKTNRQITEDGEVGKIINGVPDWVYEEEFSTRQMMQWSPDSRFLAWVKFDETNVSDFSFPLYGEGEISQYSYKYPKAGTENSKVSAHVFDYENKVSRMMKIEGEDFYLPRIFWTKSAEKLGIARLNRHQNNLQILFANPKSGLCSPIINEKNDRYIDQQSYSDIIFLNDGEHFVYQSEKDGYNHLYLYNMSGRMVRQLTSGEFDVTRFYGYDAVARKYYYQAAKKSPLEREVYSINSKFIHESVNKTAGTNNIVFSPNYAYSIRSYSSLLQPQFADVYENKKNTKLYNYFNNNELKAELANYAFEEKRFFDFVTERGDTLNGWMVNPQNFDSSKKYPVLMIQYSGPGSQSVTNNYSFGWEYYMSSLGYVVVCVDGRGTGARGQEFKKCTYSQLGKLEAEDQISTAKYLAKLPFVDGDRIAIWGWSYGGFMSALSMSMSNVFKAGIAVAPVTNLKFYDTAYSERFMRTPQENPDGYNNYSPLRLADKLEGRLLLVHGTADDNVHYQNTIEYADALVEAGKQFEIQTYRNRNHNLNGGNTRRHLYARFVDFLERNL